MSNNYFIQKYGGGRPAPVIAAPVNPYQAPQAAETLRGTQIDNQAKANEIKLKRDQYSLDRATKIAELNKTGKTLDANNNIVDIPNWRPPVTVTREPLSAAQFSDALSQYNGAQYLRSQLDDMRRKFIAGPGSTTGVRGLLDFNPFSAVNEDFDNAGNKLRAWVKQGTGTTGGENNSLAEMKLNLGAYIPQASKRDGTILSDFSTIQSLADKAEREAIQRLGGRPDASGRITPINEPPVPNAMDMARAAGTQTQAGGFMSDKTIKQMPQRFQELYQQYVTTNAGKLDPDKYAQFRLALSAASGVQEDPSRAAVYAKEAQDLNEYYAKGGRTFSTPGREENLSGLDQARNMAVNNPFGAAGVGALNMLGMGGVEALDPEGYNALRNSPNPWNRAGMLGGEVAGALYGGNKLSKITGPTFNKLMSKVTQDAGLARFGTNLANDVVYGTGYGTITQGDPLNGALYSAGGSAFGQGAGAVLGRTVSGVTSSPTVSRLYQQGVVPTIGQIFRGRAADTGGRSLVAGLEDVVSNTGGIGSLVNSARNRALENANTAGYRIAADGAPITGTGQQALDQVTRVKNNAYGAAVDGRVFDVTDPQFVAQTQAARAKGNQVDAMRGKEDFGLIDQFQLGPVVGNGPTITGRQWQDAQRLLDGQAVAYNKAATGAVPDPSAAFVGDALNGMRNSYVGLAARQAPDAIPLLKNANRINRNLSILDDAAGRALNNEGVWTAAQLGQALKANSAKFGGNRGLRSQGNQDLYQLQQDMSRVLPNEVPPTGVNVAPMLALAGAATAGTGEAVDSDTLRTLGALGLLSTPYTKTGQRMTAGLLLGAPQTRQFLGSLIRKNQGLFGTAAVPLALELQK